VKGLKRGPELKMPDLKVPDFLVDLYWDLRDRHLLPLVALVLVAIVAVPFLLGGGSKQQPPAGPVAGASVAPSPEPISSHLTVVEAKPGLRDYHKRLHHDSPTDPFRQHLTSPDLKGAKLGGGEEESASSSSSSTSSSSTSTTVTKTESSNGTTKTEVKTETNGGGKSLEETPGLTLFAFAIDVKITKTTSTADGGKDQGEPQLRHRVIPPAPLPGEKEQVATYMGISPKTRLPFFLVSNAVTGVFGEAKCLSGDSTCQLLELELGIPVTFVLASGARYKIDVLKVEPVPTGHT